MVDPDGRIVRRCAEIDKIVCLTVVVFHAEAVKYRIRHQCAKLLIVAAAVRAVGNDDGHIVRGNAADLRQIGGQVRDDKILPHPEARNVAHDQRDLLPPLCKLPQRRRVDGVVQALPQRLANVRQRRDLFSVQHAEHLMLVQRYRDSAHSVRK